MSKIVRNKQFSTSQAQKVFTTETRRTRRNLIGSRRKNSDSSIFSSLCPQCLRGERFPILILLLILTLLLTSCTSTNASPPEVRRFTGFIESETIVISPEIGGRIVEMPAAEGAEVHAGDLLTRLDDSLIQLQLAQADAQVARAEAELARLQAAVRPQDVAVAEERVQQAQAALDAAETALADAIALRDNPQELDVQIAQARATLNEIKAQTRAAQHQARAADLEAEMWGETVRQLSGGQTVTLPDGSVITVDAPAYQRGRASLQWNLAAQKAWKAWAQAKQAEQSVAQAQTALNDLLRQRQERQEAEAQVVAATNARDEAAAALVQAQAALDAVKAGPSQEQLAAAQARVEQARAAREAQATTLSKTRITAPTAGIVQESYFAAGEVIGPGQQLLRLTQPDQLTITIYVPAGMIGDFGVGNELDLVADSAPDRTYTARITAISDQPEYTTRQSQNNAERAAVLYAVTLQIVDADEALRPGLPAEVIWQ